MLIETLSSGLCFALAVGPFIEYLELYQLTDKDNHGLRQLKIGD
ncbi:hypothetical protein [Carnobacterium maltaromaticum]